MTLYIPLQAGAEQGGYTSLIMIALLFVVMWFFMIRPQQKRQKEIRKFREALTKGVTITVDKGSVYPSAGDANQSAAQQEQK